MILKNCISYPDKCSSIAPLQYHKLFLAFFPHSVLFQFSSDTDIHSPILIQPFITLPFLFPKPPYSYLLHSVVSPAPVFRCCGLQEWSSCEATSWRSPFLPVWTSFVLLLPVQGCSLLLPAMVAYSLPVHLPVVQSQYFPNLGIRKPNFFSKHCKKVNPFAKETLNSKLALGRGKQNSSLLSVEKLWNTVQHLYPIYWLSIISILVWPEILKNECLQQFQQRLLQIASAAVSLGTDRNCGYFGITLYYHRSEFKKKIKGVSTDTDN